MKMMDCPKWHSCSAPICPFWGGGIHLKDERVCFYLTESVKENAKANFEGAGVGHIFDELQTLAPSIIARWYPIRKALEKASRTGSRLTALSRNRKCPE